MADISFKAVRWPEFKEAAKAHREPFEDDRDLTLIINLPLELRLNESEGHLQDATEQYLKYRLRLEKSEREPLDLFFKNTIRFDDTKKSIDCELHPEVSENVWLPWIVLGPESVAKLCAAWQAINLERLEFVISESWSKKPGWFFQSADEVFEHLKHWARLLEFVRSQDCGAVVEIHP